MPRITQEPTAPLADSVQALLAAMPVFICGVNRKVNIGNYETVDVYAGLVLPVPQASGITDLDALRPLIEEAANAGFALASREANERYNLIKQMASGT